MDDEDRFKREREKQEKVHAVTLFSCI